MAINKRGETIAPICRIMCYQFSTMIEVAKFLEEHGYEVSGDNVWGPVDVSSKVVGDLLKTQKHRWVVNNWIGGKSDNTFLGFTIL